ncbi:MAG: efflux RND transporter periplasmic adaptor subunit [Oscillospiraceae bacterium]|nr:efflux RND transporter periplasmic adaptor subunit [Oscillospiraceae bacterium]
MIISLAACSRSDGDPVSVQSVAMITGVGSVGLSDRYAGLVVSGSTQEIKLEENMTVDEVNVEVGDEVKRGDVLFSYDNELSLLNLEQAKLELEGLRNTLTSNREQVSQLEKERSKAPSSQKLQYSLEIQELEASIREGEYNISLKEKEVERQEQATKDTQVRSAMDGRVSAINQSNETDEYGAEKPFMTIIETGNLRIKGTINELNRGSITEGMDVTIRSRTDSNVTWTGTIASVDWDNPVSGNNDGYYYYSSDEMTTSSKYPFYVTLEDYEGMFMGQHVYIEPGVAMAETSEMWLPEYYINDAEGSPWVWAANFQDKLTKRNITLGDYDEGEGAYMVLDGLASDDYIAFPDDSLKEGQPVTRYDETMFNENFTEEENYEMEDYSEEMMDMESYEGVVEPDKPEIVNALIQSFVMTLMED